jgi:hypothetical protein
LFAQRGEAVKKIVEHAMAQRTQFLPCFRRWRIERWLWLPVDLVADR